ncbi:MAG TPA: carbon-nitrogen hydrolase [Phycisphaerae bacterium]|nr:carbon-nitrogen hydrolase [Phycisphaerae bacterium]
MPTPDKFTVGIIQMSCSPDLHANMEKAVAKIREAAKLGANVICTQELFRSQYFCQLEDPDIFNLAEAIPGPSTETLGKLAKELNVAIVASLFERRAAGLYHNTAAILDATGDLLGIYRKMHIPDDPLYYEKYYFTPGDLGFKVWQTKFARIGVLVCWDQWYPEAARLTAMQDCSILFYPTAIGWHPREKAHFGDTQASAWETIQRSHAIANGVYVASPNRIGLEKIPGGGAGGGDGIEFFGGSFISDPFGKLLKKASRDKEEILIETIDPKLQEETRRNWPFFRDRRIDAYQPLLNRFSK